MRFMLIMYPGAKAQEAPSTASVEDIARMGRFNEALTRAGVLLSVDGLYPDSEGARVRFSGGKGTVTDGPFAEAKELVGGYWIIDVKSKDEAVAWASRCPAWDGDVIEVRRVAELSDFPPEVAAAAGFPETP
jgi:hypothetical protein